MFQPGRKHWNIFARELELIMTKRNLRLTQLNDRTPIHTEKVRRLVKSSAVPRNFSVLNPDEIDIIIATFHLTAQEIVSLRAAVLTNAIESLLMGRIMENEALAISEQVFPLLREAMLKGLLSGVRGGIQMMHEENIDTATDIALEGALEFIDLATMALHLYNNVDALAERIRIAHQAADYFREAIKKLAKLAPEFHATPAWQVWQQEAQKGLAISNKYLAEIEGT